jgi:hypothetical protein
MMASVGFMIVGAVRSCGIAERLRDPACRRSSDQASRSLAARLQGGAFGDAFVSFLPPEPNIRTLKHGGGEKNFSVATEKDASIVGLQRPQATVGRAIPVAFWRPSEEAGIEAARCNPVFSRPRASAEKVTSASLPVNGIKTRNIT